MSFIFKVHKIFQNLSNSLRLAKHKVLFVVYGTLADRASVVSRFLNLSSTSLTGEKVIAGNEDNCRDIVHANEALATTFTACSYGLYSDWLVCCVRYLLSLLNLVVSHVVKNHGSESESSEA